MDAKLICQTVGVALITLLCKALGLPCQGLCINIVAEVIQEQHILTKLEDKARYMGLVWVAKLRRNCLTLQNTFSHFKKDININR
jgi:hypothetical protein